MLRLIYMGTPQFAVPALEALIARSAPGELLPQGYEIVTVITRPDKPTGRGREIIFSPVKKVALAHNIPVWQPGSFKKLENSEALAAYRADLYIVAAFGQILPQVVLDQPSYGTLNIHASLLPKYRGADPISTAILQGDAETGVSIMLLDAGIDTGPVLLSRHIPIAADETTGSLTEKLAHLGAQALLEALPLWVAGTITPTPQDAQQASHTRMLRKEDGEIRWDKSALAIARQIRAYIPWPGSYTHWKGKLLKIVEAQVLLQQGDASTVPGTVKIRAEADHKTLVVVTGDGLLEVKQLQLEGKKIMAADEFLRGYGQIVGQALQ
ncbi:MAG TPA: methionyl-tRNA formyltransferase [Ktedonobacteraceae bacterium]|nr:methionyl-tRNA formyltransferase [Ktedonobacteraceae bacterium]